jgi:AtzE family amidohydrolase
MTDLHLLSATEIAAGVREGRFSAEAATSAALARIEALNPSLNCFTEVLAERALADARSVDARLARGEAVGPLAGVPFGVKNLYDVAGVTTRAGSRINRANPPAAADATLVRRLKSAGAVLLGLQNMDEYAYGFLTENAHDGTTRNPHDPKRVAGGSSGGSAASVAAGMVPLSLGTDTSGSIRVPAAFCGIFGLKASYGRLSRKGVFPFVHDLDHAGPFARSAADLARIYDVLQGPDPEDPHQAARAVEPSLPGIEGGIGGLRIGVLEGWFRDGAVPEALEGVDRVAAALGATRCVVLPEAALARSAAFCLTAAAGADLHWQRLKSRPADFDPATRDRLFAGALLPGSVVVQAQRFRRWFRDRALEIFAEFDILLAPTTPTPAVVIGEEMMQLGDRQVPARVTPGIYTQPLSFIGVPVVSVPVQHPGALPLGVQIIAAPWREATALRVARFLEAQGIVSGAVAEGVR